MTVYRIIV